MKPMCTTCGFIHNCYCEAIPTIASDLCFTLLTHPNELSRATNTGKLIDRLFASSQVTQWQRKQPCERCLPKTSPSLPVLVFPSEDSVPLEEWQAQQQGQTSNFIVLDGTWQEAKKMLNRSAWLQALPKVHLDTELLSRYALRRNQQAGNLCTFEVCAEITRQVASKHDANAMLTFFDEYTLRFQAERSGHALTR
ncbi:tRNA-uridine aminocarboxypropyltransferase [Vibrio sp. DNB22_10_4]